MHRSITQPRHAITPVAQTRLAFLHAALLWLAVGRADVLEAAVVFDRTSAYHHILVQDEGGLRTLSFNNSRETRMSLRDPLQGHFEYTEYFHMPWLWNREIKNVLMMGLGGGSAQRSFLHYHTNVTIETVELDPVVVDVAKRYFEVVESPLHRIHAADGRTFLRRSTNRYDVILMDAYSTTRYGSSLPPHLVTKEFFTLVSDHLTTNGVVAYNVIGQVRGWREKIVGAMHRTMREVFPRVYLFPAEESQNIVLIGTRSDDLFDRERVRNEAARLVKDGTVRLPSFSKRTGVFLDKAPPSAASAIVLTDNFAPIESLMQGTR